MKIEIKNLKIEIIIGTLEHERKHTQPIEINILFEYDANKAIENDDFIYAVDYKVLTDKIIDKLKHTEFFLLESLVAYIIAEIKENKLILSAKVQVRKPKALGKAEYISVEDSF
ncbi:MAG: dihydroneopterin aldolase [Candidatus Delongbacteria bacterium]|nr:dihydroneopterin aldolase [Candidatus Delongbacteria bacterium]